MDRGTKIQLLKGIDSYHCLTYIPFQMNALSEFLKLLFRFWKLELPDILKSRRKDFMLHWFLDLSSIWIDSVDSIQNENYHATSNQFHDQMNKKVELLLTFLKQKYKFTFRLIIIHYFHQIFAAACISLLLTFYICFMNKSWTISLKIAQKNKRRSLWKTLMYQIDLSMVFFNREFSNTRLNLSHQNWI